LLTLKNLHIFITFIENFTLTFTADKAIASMKNSKTAEIESEKEEE